MDTAGLTGALDRLTTEFGDRFTRERIAELVENAYERLESNATTTAFLPLLAERFARQRLQAMLRVEGTAEPKVPGVLFLCVHNAGRSQMALGWFKHLADGRAVAWSGGSEPGSEINPSAVSAMAEVGIDITREFPSRGPTRSSGPPTSSSRWVAATPVRSIRASVTRTGSSRTRPARTSRRCDRSATRSRERVTALLDSLDVGVEVEVEK